MNKLVLFQVGEVEINTHAALQLDESQEKFSVEELANDIHTLIQALKEGALSRFSGQEREEFLACFETGLIGAALIDPPIAFVAHDTNTLAQMVLIAIHSESLKSPEEIVKELKIMFERTGSFIELSETSQ